MDKSIEFFKGIIECRTTFRDGDPALEAYKEECLAELEALRKKLEWQPMETIPHDKSVLVKCKDEDEVSVGYVTRNDGRVYLLADGEFCSNYDGDDIYVFACTLSGWREVE